MTQQPRHVATAEEHRNNDTRRAAAARLPRFTRQSRIGDAGAATGAYYAVRVERNDTSKRRLRAQLQGYCVEHSERALGRGGVVKNSEKRASVFSAAHFGHKVSLGEVNIRGAPRGDYVAACSRG